MEKKRRKDYLLQRRKKWVLLIFTIGVICYREYYYSLNQSYGEIDQYNDFSPPLNKITQEQLQAAAETKIKYIMNGTDKVHSLLCKDVQIKDFIDEEWNVLCSNNFVRDATQVLLEGGDIYVVQIGAHLGFEPNDPIGNGALAMLKEVDDFHHIISSPSNTIRDHFHWTFVEPSPPNYKRLVQNLEKQSDICDMHFINAAVVSDLTNNTDNMIFYTLRDTIDPQTGFDSLSGKKLPFWITQVSAFSKLPILTNTYVFRNRGLDVNDYIVENHVDAKSYSNLIHESMISVGNKSKKQSPFLVMIDTEGFDCDIIEGISPMSSFLPKYLIYEDKSCNYMKSHEHLKAMGYDIFKTRENTLAVKRMDTGEK